MRTHHAAALVAALAITTPLTADGPAEPAAQAHAEPATHDVRISDAVTLHVRDMGAGEPVLVLAGGPGFAGTQMMPVARTVARSHRAILPDQRGSGESALDLADPVHHDPADWTFDRAVADLEAIREHLKLEKWSVTGHSWGALLAMAYAAEHPDRVTGLCLINPAGHTSDFWGPYSQALNARLDAEATAKLRSLTPTGQDDAAVAVAEYRRDSNKIMAPAMLAKDATDEQVATLRAQMDAGSFDPLVGALMTPALMSYDLTAPLAAYHNPVTVVRGDQDSIPAETAQAIVDTLPDARIVTIEDCGHFSFIEKPEELDAIVSDWLNSDAEGEPSDG